MVRTFVLAATLVLTAAAVAPAQVPRQPPPVSGGLGQGDARDRAACHPDVVRFCKELIKDDANADIFGILNCLQTNRQKISKACNEVLASHGQ
jgi:Spy/CpxP family protein refolding chaperone